MQFQIDVSVIVCCYNSEKRIQSTLEYLAKQKIDNLLCEVILVDNNCIDNTIQIAKNIWQKYGTPYNLIIVSENKAGLANARKCGVKNAKGEILLFCDDDNWLEANYIQIGYNLMKNNLLIGVLGGRSEAVFESEVPYWFTTYQGGYAVGVQELNSGNINRRGYVWGAGSFMRRKTLLKMYESGFKNYCIGRIGENLLAGDDSEICTWHILLGENLWYDENLVFYHFIPEIRLTKQYLISIRNGFKASGEFLNKLNFLIFLSQNGSIKLKLKLIFILVIKLLTIKIPISEFINQISIITNYTYFLPQDSLEKVVLKAKKKYFKIDKI